MDEAEQILLDPDRFSCDRFRCNMLRTDCLAQQIRANDISANDKGNTRKQGANHPAYRCKNCEQGKRIIEAERLKEKGIIVPIKKEETVRDSDGQNIKACEAFKIVLDFTDWGSLLGFVSDEAKEEFRAIEGQIMAIVRDRYKNENMPKHQGVMK